MSSQTGTVSSTTGTTGWTNPNNIFTSNDSHAISLPISLNGNTSYIYVLGNGFSVPTGATIDGIKITIEAKNQVSGSGFQLIPSSPSVNMLYLGSTFNAPVSAGIASQIWSSTSDDVKEFGSSTSLWAPNSTLTPAIVNHSSFGFRMRFRNTNSTAQTFSIDLIAITVYYTDSSGAQSSQQLFMFEG